MKRFYICLFGLLVCFSILLLYIKFKPYEASREIDLNNTYLHAFLNRRIVEIIIKQYQKDFPLSDISYEELLITIIDAQTILKRRSQCLTITVQSHDKDLANNLADTYSKVILDHCCDETITSIFDMVLPVIKEPDFILLSTKRTQPTEQISSSIDSIINLYQTKKLRRDQFSFKESSLVQSHDKFYRRDMFVYTFTNIETSHGFPTQEMLIWHESSDNEANEKFHAIYTAESMWPL